MRKWIDQWQCAKNWVSQRKSYSGSGHPNQPSRASTRAATAPAVASFSLHWPHWWYLHYLHLAYPGWVNTKLMMNPFTVTSGGVGSPTILPQRAAPCPPTCATEAKGWHPWKGPTPIYWGMLLPVLLHLLFRLKTDSYIETILLYHYYYYQERANTSQPNEEGKPLSHHKLAETAWEPTQNPSPGESKHTHPPPKTKHQQPNWANQPPPVSPNQETPPYSAEWEPQAARMTNKRSTNHQHPTRNNTRPPDHQMKHGPADASNCQKPGRIEEPLIKWVHINQRRCINTAVSSSIDIFLRAWYFSWPIEHCTGIDWGKKQTKGTSASLPSNQWVHLEFGHDAHHDEWLLAGLVVAI